jgi:hypothetical protein
MLSYALLRFDQDGPPQVVSVALAPSLHALTAIVRTRAPAQVHGIA